MFKINMLEGLSGIIPGGISTKDFSAITNTSNLESKKTLDFFIESGVGSKLENKYYFELGDKLKIAMELLKIGLPMEKISETLDWRDFEGLVGEILLSKNFAVVKNLILTKPRREIDIVGIRLGIAMLIDCKHWKAPNTSLLVSSVKKQIERTKHYVSKTPGGIAVPVIVTLFQDEINFIEKVPIVPIFQFSSFVDEFYGNLDQMNTVQGNGNAD